MGRVKLQHIAVVISANQVIYRPNPHTQLQSLCQQHSTFLFSCFLFVTPTNCIGVNTNEICTGLISSCLHFFSEHLLIEDARL